MVANKPSPHRLNRLQAASARLRPLAWGDALKIRAEDVAVFAAAAEVFDHIIIVRATNERSLPYVGQKGFVPKPIDCKPKTADRDAFVAEMNLFVECAGLVVDPQLIGFAAFEDEKKRGKAAQAWTEFVSRRTVDERRRQVYRRRGSKGFFAVDTQRGSRRYGCLMLSNQDQPAEDFSLAGGGWIQFKLQEMRYIHGDYDLYGLIDVDAMVGPGPHRPRVLKERLHGQRHYFSEKFRQIQAFLNRGIGAEMIQHGAQDHVGHQSDLLYVFYPTGQFYQLDASAEAIREIYQLLFHQEA
ncbi:hypothetical protein [Piscinibacter sakaiensis]|uniref:Uncharacterized protein n=1 Tax=Piscinibacter sakaiensis TaxID=1547922 RepID=A0A0K8P5T4_PISS1|nr:hypothetical protein [Piscinibacter sakaiensis]GAP37874.1 hypothetical protein ISF6_3819 [Piscinibacter sakaiensis]